MSYVYLALELAMIAGWAGLHIFFSVMRKQGITWTPRKG